MSNIEVQRVLQRRYAGISTAAVAVTVASGTFALVALLLGSPRLFGLALAVSSVGWLVTHYIARLASRDRKSVVPMRTVRPTRPLRQPLAGSRTGRTSAAYV